MPVADVQGQRLARAGDPGAELLGLDERPRRQLGAGQTGRKAQVVLDAGAGCGLPADRHRFDQHGVEPL